MELKFDASLGSLSISSKSRQQSEKQGNSVNADQNVAFELKADYKADRHDSLYWVTPLDGGLTGEFETWKRAGIQMNAFSYTVNNKLFFCKERECLLTTGQWRGHFDSEYQYWQVTVQGVSEAGDAFGIVLADGIGGGYGSADRATEDHINVNGLVYKLDETRQENRKD